MPWEPLPNPQVDPSRLADPLDRLMNRLAGASLSAIEVIMDHWSDIVGPDAAAACAPVKIADGVLTVRTSDAVWASELRWLEPTIVERAAALSGGASVRSVKVVTRGR